MYLRSNNQNGGPTNTLSYHNLIKKTSNCIPIANGPRLVASLGTFQANSKSPLEKCTFISDFK